MFCRLEDNDLPIDTKVNQALRAGSLSKPTFFADGAELARASRFFGNPTLHSEG